MLSKDLRLLADLLPDLVAPLEGLDGKELAKLAEGLCCMMLDVTVLPEVSIRLTVELADGDTAAGALSFIDSSMALFLRSMSEFVGVTTAPAVDAPKATRSDKTVVLHLDERKLTELLRGCVMPALQKARLQALAAISLSEMRATITSIMCYMAEHEGQWPAGLQAVAADEQMLKQTAAFDRYVYLRPNVTCEELKNPSQQILVYDPVDEFGEGIAVGFVDGHVERITDEASLQELLSASLEQATRVGGPASD
ncbi:MAG: hypothetical protein GXY38_06275 [Planctomycetes bacterium]|nr:hypothetical protein [Planctomycetota bacterium]